MRCSRGKICTGIPRIRCGNKKKIKACISTYTPEVNTSQLFKNILKWLYIVNQKEHFFYYLISI